MVESRPLSSRVIAARVVLVVCATRSWVMSAFERGDRSELLLQGLIGRPELRILVPVLKSFARRDELRPAPRPSLSCIMNAP